MKPVRVLHIVGIMNMGGIENLLMNLYRNIDRGKIQFDFLVTREEKGVFDEEIRQLGGRIFNIPKIAVVGYREYRKSINTFFRNHQEYKIIHCHRDALCGLYLREAKKTSIPIRIAHSHTVALANAKTIKELVGKLFKNYFKVLSTKYATDYFACSKEAGEWLFRKKGIKEHIKVIDNGIDTSKYKYNQNTAFRIRKELGIGKEYLLIGHVGRFDRAKNQEFLVEIMYRLKKSGQECKLCLVGDGELQKDMRQLVKELKLDDYVQFLGIRQNINELMMAFDVFVFPSLFEGLGIVVIEAQTTGLRCLVSDKVPKAVDIGKGLIENISVSNIESWVEHINTFNQEKKALRSRRELEKENMYFDKYDIKNTTVYLEKFYLSKYKSINTI